MPASPIRTARPFRLDRRRLPPGALAALALATQACALNPVTGRPEVVLISTEQERRIGAEEAQRIERDMGLVPDDRAAAYVRAIGERLAPLSPRQDVVYRFFVVDQPEPNAFALPGGYVYVSRGLLALANSEDELACVIGHEIGHVAARHAVQRVTRAAPVAIVSGLGSALTGTVSPTLGRLVGGVTQLAGAAFLAPYGRGQETQADRIGQELAARAGYDPAALTRFLRTLEREEGARLGRRRMPGFFDTHPSTPERVEETAETAAALERAAPARIADGRAAFLARLDGLLVGRNPAEGVFRDALFLHPDLDLALRFPAGWSLANTRRAVFAAEPEGAAVVVLGPGGPGSDPLAAAAAFSERTGVRFREAPAPARIGGLPAARAEGRGEDAALDLTWIALDERLYLITGGTTPERFDAFAGVFRQVARSFRRLTAAERGSVKADRLRAVAVRPGETTLEALIERAGATWTPQQAAIANALEPPAALRPGQLVKLPLPQTYTPRSRPAAAPAARAR